MHSILLPHWTYWCFVILFPAPLPLCNDPHWLSLAAFQNIGNLPAHRHKAQCLLSRKKSATTKTSVENPESMYRGICSIWTCACNFPLRIDYYRAVVGIPSTKYIDAIRHGTELFCMRPHPIRAPHNRKSSCKDRDLLKHWNHSNAWSK